MGTLAENINSRGTIFLAETIFFVQMITGVSAVLAVVFKIAFVCYMRKNGILYKDLLKGILTPGDIPNWVVVILCDVIFMLAAVVGALPVFHVGSPCAREGYHIPNSPGLSFMKTILSLFVLTCYPTQELIDNSNISSAEFYPMQEQFFWSHVVVWIEMGIISVVMFGVVLTFELSPFAIWRTAQAKREMLAKLCPDTPVDEPAAHAVFDEAELAKIDHLAESRTDVYRLSIAPYVSGAFVGFFAGTLVWSDTLYDVLLASDSVMYSTGTAKAAQLQHRFHVMEGAYPMFVNSLACLWCFLTGFSAGTAVIILALRFTQNTFVLTSFREMTNENKAAQWELPFMNLKTLQGIRTFVSVRQFYLQNEFEDEYELFSIFVGAVGMMTMVVLTFLVVIVLDFTPKVISGAGILAIVVFNYLYVVASFLLCGISMMFLASAAGIYQEQAQHKNIFKQTLRHLVFMHDDEPHKKRIDSLSNAQQELEEETEAPHACGIPIKPDAFRILVGYAAVALTAVIYRLVSSRFM